MRIIQITPDFPPRCGGIGHYVVYLSEELIKRGHEVSVLFRGNSEDTYSYKKIPVVEFKIPGVPPLNTGLLKNRLETILADRNIDLVHIHYGAIPAINCRVPVIVTAHFCNREGIYAFHRPIRNLDSLYRNMMLPVYTRIEAKQIFCCDKLTVVSESLKKEFQKHYQVNSEVIYNGVDTELFDGNKNIEKEDAVLYTGGLKSGKGIQDLLQIAKLLKRNYKEVVLYIIGDGYLRKWIAGYLKKENLYNVTLLKHLSHTKLIDYYHRAKVYVIPSYHEGFPNTVLEAMACKLPVVASNVGGIPDQIDDGVNGYLLSPGDIKGFYNKIVSLLADREKCSKFGQMGRRKVLANFTWSHVASKVEKKYHEILKA